MFGIGYIQVLYLGRALCTKETLPDFREKCRVTRHSRVFRGLTGSQRTPGFWGVTSYQNNNNNNESCILHYLYHIYKYSQINIKDTSFPN